MNNLFDLTGKVALVTGASSGLGVQFAKALAGQGASIVILARRKDRLDALAKELEESGTKCLAIECDVLKEEDIVSAVNRAVDHFGRIDILVNNAGIANAYKAEDQPTSEWEKVININLNACFVVAREVGKVMIKQKYGRIINIGSIHSNFAISSAVHTVSAYAASKGGISMLTKALAAEWAQHNITVNAIGPAYFASEMTQDAVGNKEFTDFIAFRCPMGRIGNPGELNSTLIYFAAESSSYTTGQLLTIDGGWSCV